LNIDLIIWDLDGTLADTAPDIAWALRATLDEIGVATPPLDVVQRMVGDGGRALIERALRAAQVEADAQRLLPRFVEHYASHLCVGSRLYPGVSEVIASARAAGIAQAVLTNKPGQLARGLVDALALSSAFVAVVGDGDGNPRKPDPAGGLSIIERVGTTPVRTAVIGDGIPDVQIARAMGAVAIAAGWGYVASDRLRAEAPHAVAATPDEAWRLVCS
jgi:phosphoglycolate phosphatase